MYWYPRRSKGMMKACLESDWGRLFQNWGQVGSTETGFPDVGEARPEFHRNVWAMLKQAVKVLGTCIVEAPEFAARRRKK